MKTSLQVQTLSRQPVCRQQGWGLSGRTWSAYSNSRHLRYIQVCRTWYAFSSHFPGPFWSSSWTVKFHALLSPFDRRNVNRGNCNFQHCSKSPAPSKPHNHSLSDHRCTTLVFLSWFKWNRARQVPAGAAGFKPLPCTKAADWLSQLPPAVPQRSECYLPGSSQVTVGEFQPKVGALLLLTFDQFLKFLCNIFSVDWNQWTKLFWRQIVLFKHQNTFFSA